MSGDLGTDRQPLAITYQRQVTVSPASVRTSHRLRGASHLAAVTPVANAMSRRRS
jgi:hypothetical protein